MKRRSDVPDDRPPIPEVFRRMDFPSYRQPGEQPENPSDEASCASFGVKLYRRWKAASDAWAAEHGYTQHEMYDSMYHVQRFTANLRRQWPHLDKGER